MKYSKIFETKNFDMKSLICPEGETGRNKTKHRDLPVWWAELKDLDNKLTQ